MADSSILRAMGKLLGNNPIGIFLIVVELVIVLTGLFPVPGLWLLGLVYPDLRNFRFRKIPLRWRIVISLLGIFLMVITLGLLYLLVQLTTPVTPYSFDPMTDLIVHNPVPVLIAAPFIFILALYLLRANRLVQQHRAIPPNNLVRTQRRGEPPLMLLTQQARLTAADSVERDHFGSAVALDGHTAVVSMRSAVGISTGDGSDSAISVTATRENGVYVFIRTGTNWTQQAKLMPDDGDNFSARLAIYGDNMVVAASNQTAHRSIAYVFHRTAANWQIENKLIVSDAGHRISAVAMGENLAAVGLYPHQAPGMVLLYGRSTTGWTPLTTLTASGQPSNFGCSLAIAGNTIIVGSSDADGGRGAAYVFARHDTVWLLEQKLVPTTRIKLMRFGESVAIRNNTVLIGAPGDYAHVGAVYVFRHGAGKWTRGRVLVPSDRVRGGFGGSVALMTDNVAVIGAPLKYDAAGRVYTFLLTGSAWKQDAAIIGANNTAPGDFLGNSISADPDAVILGAHGRYGLKILGGPAVLVGANQNAGSAGYSSVYIRTHD